MRTKVTEEVPLSTDRPEDMPECFGELFDPQSLECLQCKAFQMCAYFSMKKEQPQMLDDSRILSITDGQIREYIGVQKSSAEVFEWLLKEGRIIDKVAGLERLKRFLANPDVRYKDKIITVL